MVISNPYLYPHHLFKKTETESSQDENGDWTEGTTTWEYIGTCRAETAGAGAMISSSDGRLLYFSDQVFMPAGTAKIAEGTQIAVFKTKPDTVEIHEGDADKGRRDGSLLAFGEIKKFDEGRLHSRLWL